ncbi:MAG: cation diffusion facilitator family transporter [Anaerolineae bacterium]|nr:cation diffusion facilitator family transporter [Anaerolineae bacterium]
MQMQFIREARPDPKRRRRLKLAVFITILGNLGLAVGKGVVAAISGSAALYADAANSISDVFYSLLMSLGLWISQQPPDQSHPQGHSRFEPLAGLMVAAAMTIAAYEAARMAVVQFIAGGTAVSGGWPTVALVTSAIIKALMYVWIHRIAGQVASPALDAAAKDNLSDVLTSLAAFVGTLGSRFIHPLADPIAGALVAIWIAKSAVAVWSENLKYLTGGGAPAGLHEEIIQAAKSVDGVLRVHQVIAEHAGPEIVADLHINIDGDLPLFAAHAISDEVHNRVTALTGIDRAYVHVEPCEVGAFDDTEAPDSREN